MPSKTEYFEPAAKILLDEYEDYLNRVLLGKKTALIYQSERENKIKDTSILIKELFFRFAFEILQYHNENERDGEKLLNGFAIFLKKLKESNCFTDDKGIYKDSHSNC